MIDLEQLQSYYPDYLKPFKKNILREYFQYKILEIIYNSEYYNQLIFMGGTSLRILYDNQRFSEDLDFDNQGLAKDNFIQLSKSIEKGLGLEGYNVEIRNTFKGAFRCFLKIKDITYTLGLSPHEKEKIDIRLDTENQNFDYSPNRLFINKFGIFTQVYSVPIDILLSQKIYAIINRPRPMGRDFYDTVFLMGKTTPNYKYLEKKADIKTREQLRSRLLSRCERLDLDLLAKDIQPFIFKPSDANKVKMFAQYIDNLTS